MPQWLDKTFADERVTGSIIYRESKRSDGGVSTHSRRGQLLDSQARVVCRTCNSTWMNDIEGSVRTILPKVIKGREVLLTCKKQEALATWAVKTILMLQHTHRRADQRVFPPSDYTEFFVNKAPSHLMKVLTAYMEPPGRGSNIEGTVEYLAEDRGMADVARLLEAEGGPAPVDMRAYTATLRIGCWVSHVIRVGSPQIIAGLDGGPTRRYALTIWPSHGHQTWPPRSLAEVGGLLTLARSIDAGVSIA